MFKAYHPRNVKKKGKKSHFKTYKILKRLVSVSRPRNMDQNVIT